MFSPRQRLGISLDRTSDHLLFGHRDEVSDFYRGGARSGPPCAEQFHVPFGISELGRRVINDQPKLRVLPHPYRTTFESDLLHGHGNPPKRVAMVLHLEPTPLPEPITWRSALPHALGEVVQQDRGRQCAVHRHDHT